MNFTYFFFRSCSIIQRQVRLLIANWIYLVPTLGDNNIWKFLILLKIIRRKNGGGGEIGNYSAAQYLGGECASESNSHCLSL